MKNRKENRFYAQMGMEQKLLNKGFSMSIRVVGIVNR